MKQELLLFPLNEVLFPQGELPIRIFELRYRRLLDECGQTKPFGVVRIRYGAEVGEPAFPYNVGCSAFIMQQVAMPDGSIIAFVMGHKRFKILTIHVEDDGLARAQIEWLKPEAVVPIPNDLYEIAQAFTECGDRLSDAGSLAWRLAEALPLSLDEQQQLLEEENPHRRLQLVKKLSLKYPIDFI